MTGLGTHYQLTALETLILARQGMCAALTQEIG
jgi:hypothetical protein